MGGFGAAVSLIGEGVRALGEEPGYSIATLFLSLIFVWSGLVKLRRPALAAMAMVDFKVARRVRPSLGFALGAGELVLALALALGGPASHFTLAVVAALLWVFALLIARSLWSGERFACFCFGDTDSMLSRWTLLRTGLLALLASTLAATAAPVDAYRGPEAAPVLELVVAAAILGTVVLLGRVPDLWKWNREVLEPNVPETGGDT
ncbi:MauE/DoxX family redox-associated membrane protein [Rubrobacter calidifluminis]|uniref:MauE/DoxX family redox-associated membrane protein n=1 Tax=Rubrobacter calidifluminis TaxID=1392640 RepID=UPI0023610402|nr:MauE/DoxX family redox-associated membrane protein [Rubrobacter calidifluminis]